MFDPHQKMKQVRAIGFKKNWESNIDTVELERCNEQEDPLGYRVVFHQCRGAALPTKNERYVIGASFLKARLDNLKKSGFDAPMTMQAITMIEKQTGCCLLGRL
jgi:hypothetical protein